ncbi:hypothetical protein V8B97DRAFT_1480709 [Scleroderma yunnanense]
MRTYKYSLQSAIEPQHHDQPRISYYTRYSLILTIIMCHRRVQCARYACGDEEPFSEEKVDCLRRWCRYSSAHPRDCRPNCQASCVQWMDRAVTQVSEIRNGPCYHHRQHA